MKPDASISAIGPCSQAEEDLVFAAKIGDLQGMREALAQGARPHFWFPSEVEDDPQQLECPATSIVSNLQYEPAVKLRALDVLYEAGMRSCVPAPGQKKSVLSALLPNLPIYEDCLLEWFIDKKVGITIEEGVGAWLQNVLPHFSSDYPSHILRHIASMKGDQEALKGFSLMAEFVLISNVGRCCVVASNNNAQDQEKARAFDRLDALFQLLPHLSLTVGMRLNGMIGEPPSNTVVSTALAEFMGVYPDEARANRAMSLLVDAFSGAPKEYEVQGWDRCIEDFSKGALASDTDGTRRAWMTRQARIWFAAQEALDLDSATPSVAPSVSKIRF